MEKERRLLLHFKPVTIAPGCTEKVEATPDINFLGEKVLSDSLDLSGLLVDNIFVGCKKQMSDKVPADTFRNGVSLQMDKCQAKESIAFQVTNNSDAEKLFGCTLIGKRWA